MAKAPSRKKLAKEISALEARVKNLEMTKSNVAPLVQEKQA
jgi:hypothetical protein